MPLREHPLYPRWPEGVVPDAGFAFTWQGQRSTAPNSDARIVRQSRPYWYGNLSGCECNERQKDQILAIQWRQRGMTIPVLVRVGPFCEIGRIVGRNVFGDPVVEPAFLDNGDGTQRTVKPKKRLLVPGYENEFMYYPINHVHIDYPAILGIGETAFGPIELPSMPEFKVFDGNENELARGAVWDINRDTAEVTHTHNGPIYCSGGFYIPMLLPESIEWGQKGGIYPIKNAVRIEEPRGSK